VSDQAMAMVEADMIEASVDPGVVRIKENTSGDADLSKKRYIPDVFYMYKNQYNLQVKESAKPCFPTDYLCVSLTNGFPNVTSPLFVASAGTSFPTENRPGLHDQSLDKVLIQVNKLIQSLPRKLDECENASSPGKGKEKEVDPEDLASITMWLSDWHLLAFLDTVGIFDKSDMVLLAKVATRRKPEDIQALVKSSAWQTLVTIASEHSSAKGVDETPSSISEIPDFPTDADGFPIIPDDHDMMRMDTPLSPPSARSGDFPGSNDAGALNTIVCPHCTFENSATNQDCEICSLPLRG